MALPIASSYSAPSGAAIYAGRFAGLRLSGAAAGDSGLAGGGFQAIATTIDGNAVAADGSAGGSFQLAPLPTVVWIGDSLTADSYSSCPFKWANASGLLRPIANIGVPNETVNQVLSRIDNAYTAGSPGLAGLPEALGIAFLRIGTNNARAGVLTPTIQGQYVSLIAKILSYAQECVIFPVPPIGAPEAGANANVPAYNAYLQTLVAADPAHLYWADDCVNMKDGSGNAITAKYIDGVHFTPEGQFTAGVSGAAALEPILALWGYASPLSTSALDVYPAQPQWAPNPTNTGTGGTIGSGFSGTLPNGYTINANGAGNSGVCSIVAADVGDPNQVPWARITFTGGNNGSGGTTRLTFAASGRTISTIDPARLDMLAQVRFNGVDLSKTGGVNTWLQASTGDKLVSDVKLLMGGTGTYSGTVVPRTHFKRPTAVAAAGATQYFDLIPAAVFSGSAGTFGSIDIRCNTIRG